MAQKLIVNGNRAVISSDEMLQLLVARGADQGNTLSPSDVAGAITVADLIPVIQRLITKVNKLEADNAELRSRQS